MIEYCGAECGVCAPSEACAADWLPESASWKESPTGDMADLKTVAFSATVPTTRMVGLRGIISGRCKLHSPESTPPGCSIIARSRWMRLGRLSLDALSCCAARERALTISSCCCSASKVPGWLTRSLSRNASCTRPKCSPCLWSRRSTYRYQCKKLASSGLATARWMSSAARGLASGEVGALRSYCTAWTSGSRYESTSPSVARSRSAATANSRTHGAVCPKAVPSSSSRSGTSTGTHCCSSCRAFCTSRVSPQSTHLRNLVSAFFSDVSE
mmetsp:Transcript_16567/g.39580  ORF Transcript_16567/g.39580 Transcript_16567/m.39580 type:complete len:271 (+) Transcript_16567:924-1736(+)